MSSQSHPEDRLSEREELILQAVVQSYITSAEPAGSRAIVKRFDLALSPATVRNVMADLEDMGYLQQLHTSSGRVPTDRGYRYYVNHLMRVQELAQGERDRLETEFARRVSDTDQVMRHTSQLLALVSHHTSIVEAPDEGQAEIRRVELMPIGGSRVAILVADTFGRVHTMVVPQEQALADAEMERVGRFLNDNLRGTSIDSLAHTIEARVRLCLDEQRHLAERALKLLDLLPQRRLGQLFLEGATQLFEQPEFHDIGKARQVFTFLEEREELAGLLRKSIAENDRPGARILIGSETERKGLEEISVVSAHYEVGGRPVGMIGVLGPRRMHYSKLTALVEYTAGMLGKMLTRMSNS